MISLVPQRLLLVVSLFAAHVALLPTHVVAQSRLPRVLILGDSVYRQPAAELAKSLKGKVELVFPASQPGVVHNSTTAIEHLDRWLGKQKWDVIHFNVGLGDLIYRAPNMNSFRVLPPQFGGVRATTPERYRANLVTLVQRLQATGAKLVWAHTTPIRHSATNVFELGTEVEYNQIAAKVMAAHGVQVNDMYSHVRELINMKRPASHGADPFNFDKKSIAPPILAALQRALQDGSADSR